MGQSRSHPPSEEITSCEKPPSTVGTPIVPAVVPVGQKLLRSTTSPIDGKLRFEWTVKDFLTVFAGLINEVKSATFDVVADAAAGSNNTVSFHLSGKKKILESEDFFNIYLNMDGDEEKSVRVEFNMAVLKADGVTQHGLRKSSSTCTFTKDAPSWGFHKMVSMQTLIDAGGEELLPGGHLTIVCELLVRFGATHSPPVVVTGLSPTFAPDLSASIASMLASSCNLSDVTIKCGDRSIPAHRVILAARSDVFKTMFDRQGKFVEFKNREIPLKDVDPDIVDKFIRAFYSDSVCDDITNEDRSRLLQLLKAADMYNFAYLKSICEEKLARGLNAESAASILSWAMACNADQLMAETKKYMEENVAKVVKTAAFADLVRIFPDVFNEDPAGEVGGDGGNRPSKKAKLQ